MRDRVAAPLAPRNRDNKPTASAEPVTAPHDGGALSSDGSGARESGLTTA
ncbi:hypothetical protein GCM10010211_55680 [Streptomyces albospinus]|uniref:Uncharacterized protein n=1 Tax=Streptomyces albospinus TaxID=285515 RepID=A0ABQ2VE75_9ACTN|nr:hypothetical protein [Streptomyces albospinus]GGU82539.1 hypothetical protein GCM10010211_55680 [Streptomyces albospinus]